LTRIFLHAGQPKTGTTAIQFFLGENRQALSDIGYLFPKEGSSRLHNHGPLISDILGETNAPHHRGSARRLKRLIDARAAPNFVISAERLFADLLSSSAAGRRSLVLDFLIDTGARIDVLIYIRADLDLLNSGYAQMVKSFRFHAPISEYVNNRLRNSFKSIVGLRALRMPPTVDVIFRPYNKTSKQGVVRDFLSAIQLPGEQVAALGSERRLNDAIGPIALESARTTLADLRGNGLEPSLSQRTALRRALFELIREFEPETPFWGIDAELARSIDRLVREDRQAFAQAVWGVPWTAVFEAEERTCNAFDPGRAGLRELSRFRDFRDRLGSAARAIMSDGATPKELA
jgi:hypothetical protein